MRNLFFADKIISGFLFTSFQNISIFTSHKKAIKSLPFWAIIKFVFAFLILCGGNGFYLFAHPPARGTAGPAEDVSSHSSPIVMSAEKEESLLASERKISVLSQETANLDTSLHASKIDASTWTPPFPALLDVILEKLSTYLAQHRVLALDGGGVRGVYTAQILNRIETRTGYRIHELFKGSITGTSTGSFIALGLVCPKNYEKAEKRPYHAEEIVGFYRKSAGEMFSGSCAPCNTSGCGSSHLSRLFCCLRTLTCFGCCGSCHNFGRLCGPKYKRASLDKKLQNLLGEDTRLYEAVAPVQVTAFALGKPSKLLRLSSSDFNTQNTPFWQSAAASSAAPTYFDLPLTPVTNRDGRVVHQRTVDGGLYENNPTLAALQQGWHIVGKQGDITDFTVVSIGTGRVDKEFNENQLQYGGLGDWADTAIKAAMEGTSEATDLSFRRIFDSNNYYRMQTTLPPHLMTMDNSELSNIDKLIEEANDLCDDKTSSFEGFVQRIEVEKAFLTNMRKFYQDLDEETLLFTLAELQSFVGHTHQQTKQKIDKFLAESGEFILAYQLEALRDERLLKALRAILPTVIRLHNYLEN